MLGLLRLELRKQGLAFIGLALVIALSIPLSWIAASLSHSSLSYTLLAVFSGWAQVGVPVFAALLGAAAGAGLRSESSSRAECILPLSPTRRMAGALAVSWTQLATLAGLIYLIALAVEPDAGNIFVEPAWTTAVLQRAAFSSSAFGLSYILLMSFFCAYVFAHGLAGGLLGALLAGVGYAALAGAGGLQLSHEDRDLLNPDHMLIVKSLSLGFVGYALALMPSRLERRAGQTWRDWIICGLALLLGPLLCVLTWAQSFSILVTRLRPVVLDPYTEYSDLLAQRLLPGALGFSTRGLLVENMEGELALVQPDGSLETLVPAQGLLNGRAFAEGDRQLRRRQFLALWDGDGSLWAMRLFAPDGTQARTLFHGRPGERLLQVPMHEDVTVTTSLIRRGRHVGVVSYPGVHRIRFTPLKRAPHAASRLIEQDALWGDPQELISDGWAEEGLVATVSKNRMVLRWQNQAWRLPGPAVDKVIPAVTPGRAPVFIVNVREADHWPYAVSCRPGAKAKTLWPGQSFHPRGVSVDGTLWQNPERYGGIQRLDDPLIILMLGPDGNPKPILNVRPAMTALLRGVKRHGRLLGELAILLRVADGEAWVLACPCEFRDGGTKRIVAAAGGPWGRRLWGVPCSIGLLLSRRGADLVRGLGRQSEEAGLGGD